MISLKRTFIVRLGQILGDDRVRTTEGLLGERTEENEGGGSNHDGCRRQEDWRAQELIPTLRLECRLRCTHVDEEASKGGNGCLVDTN